MDFNIKLKPITGHGEVVYIVSRRRSVWPTLSVASKPSVDKTRILFQQFLRTKAQFLHYTWNLV
jgi:hypothetical protein